MSYLLDFLSYQIYITRENVSHYSKQFQFYGVKNEILHYRYTDVKFKKHKYK